MDTNFQDHIDLDNISDEAYFSKYHFIRLFKTIYGKTPHKYLTYVRMEKAKNYLEQNLKIEETCYKVGFDSVSSFAGLFKRLNGLTASEYQRLYKTRQKNIKNKPIKFIPNCFAEQKGWT